MQLYFQNCQLASAASIKPGGDGGGVGAGGGYEGGGGKGGGGATELDRVKTSLHHSRRAPEVI
jgi:uncharacterized membrane protein YgcG